LQETTTYTAVISREWQVSDYGEDQFKELTLFKMRDMVYTWTQEGSNNYYSYPAMSSYIKSDGTFYLYLAGSNS
jgi:hypothetical protein